MIALQTLLGELAITVSDEAVWLAIGQGLLFGGVCLLFGILVARGVGLLSSDAPAGETLGVGLASGLMVLAAWWAAIWSGGRSAFTPVAVGFAIAIALAVARRLRHQAAAEAPTTIAAETAGEAAHRSSLRSLVVTTLAGGVFVVAVALLYGATMAPSPRGGLQPVEFVDEAFYAVLGRDLATTGEETNFLPSGFAKVEGQSSQTWYHWGELWLASAIITLLGTPPVAARFFIVLPIALLAASAVTGTLVRRLAGTDSRQAYLLGFFACVLLAPVPVIPGPFFSSWAVGMIFGITLYGLGALAGLLALYSVVTLGRRTTSWALAGFVGCAVAFILPAHLAIAALAFVGVVGIWSVRIGRSSTATRRLPIVPPIWVRALAATAVTIVATVAWGMLTGHGTGGATSATLAPSLVVSPFNVSWRDSVAITILGAGLFLAIPAAWFVRRRESPTEADLYLGAMGLLVVGAIGWGARLGDFTMFYLFFAGIAVFATPVAAVAVRVLWEHLRATKHLALAAGLVALCLIQLELGAVNGTLRLQLFGPNTDEPIPLSLLDEIRQLPADAKLAYSCRPLEEVGFATPRLLSVDAHTGRRIVPMCFEAETLSALNGAPLSDQVENLFFPWAPQRALYPNAAARPSSAAVAAFLKDHGIGYIYADALHPNSLVDGAIPIATSGEGRVLRVP